jgi:hypothetical protein
MKYNASDFNEMRFDVFRTGQVKMTDFYPVLGMRTVLTEVPDLMDKSLKADSLILDRLIRFCVLFCVKDGNPLSRERDLKMKKKAIYQLLNINETQPVFVIIERWHSWFLSVLSAVLSVSNDRLYSTWISLRISYEEMLDCLRANALESDDPQKMLELKLTIQKNLASYKKSLDEMEAQLFPDANTRDMVHNFEAFIAEGKGGFAEFMVARQWDQ